MSRVRREKGGMGIEGRRGEKGGSGEGREMEVRGYEKSKKR